MACSTFNYSRRDSCFAAREKRQQFKQIKAKTETASEPPVQPPTPRNESMVRSNVTEAGSVMLSPLKWVT